MSTLAWRPLPPVAAGELLPCGSNADGTILEFFANPDDVAELISDGLMFDSGYAKRRYSCELTSTPHYANGDVQIRAHLLPAEAS